jgi:hypothetical protein
MLQKPASFFSWIFQPLMMPLYGTFLFLQLPYYAFMLMSDKLVKFVLICNLTFTVVLPALVIILMYRMKIISNVRLNNREDRKYPILFTAGFHLANFYLLTKVELPAPYYLFLLGGLFSVLLTLMITMFWKISIHMTGIGSVCGAILICGLIWQIDVRLLLAVLFIIAGIIASSRLILNAHTRKEVAAGFTAGFLPQLLLIFLLY